MDGDSPELGPMDMAFRDTNMIVLMMFGCCCGFFAFALSLVEILTAKDDHAKSKATIVLLLSSFNMIFVVTLQLARLSRSI